MKGGKKNPGKPGLKKIDRYYFYKLAQGRLFFQKSIIRKEFHGFSRVDVSISTL